MKRHRHAACVQPTQFTSEIAVKRHLGIVERRAVNTAPAAVADGSDASRVMDVDAEESRAKKAKPRVAGKKRPRTGQGMGGWISSDGENDDPQGEDDDADLFESGPPPPVNYDSDGTLPDVRARALAIAYTVTRARLE